MSRLEQLSAAWDKGEGDEPEPLEPEATPAAEEPEPLPTEAADPSGQQGKPMELTSPETAAERDTKGRFQKTPKPAPSKLAPQKGTPPAPKPTDAAAPAATPTPAATTKPPPSWRPGAKDAWAKVPPEVQAEVQRREREIAQGLQEAAPLKQFHSQFQQVMAPYATMLAADGAQPLQAVQTVFQTVAALRMGSQSQRDGVIASIIREYGGSVDGINAHLQGQPPAQQQQPQGYPQQVQPQQFRDPRLDQMLAQQQQRVASEAAQEMQSFVESNEFMDSPGFRNTVADILENAAAAKRPLTPEAAYKIALQLDSDVQSVLSQREKAKAANAQLASTQRSRAAASSVRSQPAGIVVSNPSGPMSRRERLSKAFDEAQE